MWTQIMIFCLKKNVLTHKIKISNPDYKLVGEVLKLHGTDYLLSKLSVGPVWGGLAYLVLI